MDHTPCSGSPYPLPLAGKQPNTRLVRCKSEKSSTSPPKSRSRSNAKARSFREPESNKLSLNIHSPKNINTRITSPVAKKKKTVNESNFVQILPRKKPTSPSAWALSPGRVAPCPSPVPPKPPSPGGKMNGERSNRGGGISGVLKYFRQKKAVSTEEADRLYYTLMSNRLLQWRFANARAETAMSTVKNLAEKKTFNAWLKILAIKNSNMAKQMEVQKLKNDIKLYHLMNSQLFLLEKWSKLEAKNFESVGRVVRKLSVASLNVPLVHDSKGDALAVRDVMDNAETLLENIELTITNLDHQAEKSCYLLTELSIIVKQEKDCLEELVSWITIVSSLKFQMMQEKERSLRAHLIQQE
ncbi:QWRF motif-containing protein 7-like [Rutidosis leptorrhynchoides]|uniref:QWRF motif-containing protein 7-like n=1 Tax=Rutidosis leptorrhynchoides TaxID=125765 RepID=UPI003A991C39